MIKKIALLAATTVTSANVAFATDFIAISDASEIRWQVNSTNKVYLRNLNEFDDTFLGCCYNYWIDASTESGKSFLAVLLARSASGASINIGIQDRTAPSIVNYLGAW